MGKLNSLKHNIPQWEENIASPVHNVLFFYEGPSAPGRSAERKWDLKVGVLPANQVGEKGLLQGMQLIHLIKNERREVRSSMERMREAETVKDRGERVKVVR